MYTFNYLKKNLKKEFKGLRVIKVALLSDSSSQLLCQAIKGFGYENQINFEIYESDYNQIDRQIFDSTSELYLFNPDFIFINNSSEHLIKKFYELDKGEKQKFAINEKLIILNYFKVLTAKLKAKIIVNTLPEINDYVFGNFASKVDVSFVYQIKKTNIELMNLSKELKDLFICDIASLVSILGYNFTFDSKIYINADIVYSIDFLPYIAKHISDIVMSIIGVFKKCLILDLDNTIWGGIIGDDGIEGIQIGELGIGKAFSELQLWAKQLKNRGIILAVCSKNTEEIAKEPFISHPDMVLKLEDISVFVANWKNKVDNIKYIQKVLNIGFDSIVFIDDNPFERGIVKQGIPELIVPDLPDDPCEYLRYIRMLNLFETSSYTEVDEIRTNLYKEEAQRIDFHKNFDSEEQFLETIGMISNVSSFNTFSIPRVSQLTQRSNQFNLRTIRYSEKEIIKITNSDNYLTFSINLEDKFGNHGLISAVIVKKWSNDTLFIDTWIMSCRVLKRGVENFTLNRIVKIAKEKGFKKIIGEYIATKKNLLVKGLLKDLGFIFKDDKWILDVNDYKEKENYIN